MGDLVQDILAYVGATLIVTRSSLFGTVFEKVRLSGVPFLSCPMCVGFWMGAVPSYIGAFSSGLGLLLSFRVGLLVSLASYVIVSLMDLVLSTMQKQNGV